MKVAINLLKTSFINLIIVLIAIEVIMFVLFILIFKSTFDTSLGELDRKIELNSNEIIQSYTFQIKLQYIQTQKDLLIMMKHLSMLSSSEQVSTPRFDDISNLSVDCIRDDLRGITVLKNTLTNLNDLEITFKTLYSKFTETDLIKNFLLNTEAAEASNCISALEVNDYSQGGLKPPILMRKKGLCYLLSVFKGMTLRELVYDQTTRLPFFTVIFNDFIYRYPISNTLDSSLSKAIIDCIEANKKLGILQKCFESKEDPSKISINKPIVNVKGEYVQSLCINTRLFSTYNDSDLAKVCINFQVKELFEFNGDNSKYLKFKMFVIDKANSTLSLVYWQNFDNKLIYESLSFSKNEVSSIGNISLFHSLYYDIFEIEKNRKNEGLIDSLVDEYKKLESEILKHITNYEINLKQNLYSSDTDSKSIDDGNYVLNMTPTTFKFMLHHIGEKIRIFENKGKKLFFNNS